MKRTPSALKLYSIFHRIPKYIKAALLTFIVVIQFTQLSKVQLKSSARVLANAFFNYPLYEYSLPDKLIRKNQLHILFETEVKYAFNYGMVYATSENFEGIMYCLPHSAVKISSWNILKCGALRIPFKIGLDFIKRQQIVQKLQAYLQKKYMKHHSVYLWSIGIDPQQQDRGYGKNLVQFLLHSLSKQKKSCYLETVQDQNVDVYSHLGFKCVENCPIPNTDLVIRGLVWDNHY